MLYNIFVSIDLFVVDADDEDYDDDCERGETKQAITIVYIPLETTEENTNKNCIFDSFD